MGLKILEISKVNKNNLILEHAKIHFGYKQYLKGIVQLDSVAVGNGQCDSQERVIQHSGIFVH